jgi:hypothetical protein
VLRTRFEEKAKIVESISEKKVVASRTQVIENIETKSITSLANQEKVFLAIFTPLEPLCTFVSVFVIVTVTIFEHAKDGR